MNVFHSNDLKCGDLSTGISLGVTSIVLLFLAAAMYCSNCITKYFVPLACIFSIGALSYNFYLYETINYSCKQHYERIHLWGFYTYMLIALVINLVLIMGFSLYYCNRISNNGYEQLDV